ncbi:MAG: hypothetical protein R3C12_25230 [Planctomycetaceae bacterium]
MGAGPFDIALVEGSITTAHDAERIQQVRQSAKTLITVGACALRRGDSGLAELGRPRRVSEVVYPRPEYIESLATSTPISAHVPVDFELQGCPVNTGQLVGILADVLHGGRSGFPIIPSAAHSASGSGLRGSGGVLALGPILRRRVAACVPVSIGAVTAVLGLPSSECRV